MNKIFKKLKNHKYRNLICVLGLVFVCVVLPHKVFAGVLDIIGLTGLINGIFYYIGELFGVLVTLLIGFLMRVAAYNDFTTSEAVRLGWGLMRDVCNMFFIVILMVIAVCTIIRVEAYNYKKMLPTLLIKAVLINFSLMFCGLLIDVSQVVTLTFVKAFSTAGTGNFITGLGLDQVYALSRSGQITDVTTTLLYGMITLAIATIVIAALVFVFLGRIIGFWILIVLSPFTFLASASGWGSKYADQWWSEFTKYLIVGPVLAFFLWLSLSIMNQASLGTVAKTMTTGLPSVGFSKGGEPDNFVAFCISITMLLGSLVAAQKIGTAGSGAAGKAMSGMKKTGMTWVNWGGRRLDDVAGRRLTKWTAGLGYLGVSGLEKIGLKSRRLGETKKALNRVYGEGGVALRTVPSAWGEETQRKEAERTMMSRGLSRDIFSAFLHGESTNAAFKAQMQLINEKAKSITDTSTESEFTRDQFFNAYDSNNFTEMAAALKVLFSENNHNDILKDDRWRDPKYADAKAALIHDGENQDELVADPQHLSRFYKHLRKKTGVSKQTMGGLAFHLQEISVGKKNPGWGGVSDIDKDGNFIIRDLDDQAQAKEHESYVKAKTANMGVKDLAGLHPTSFVSEVSKLIVDNAGNPVLDTNGKRQYETRYDTKTPAQEEVVKLIASTGNEFAKIARPDSKLAFTGFRHVSQLENQEWGDIYNHMNTKYRHLMGNKFFDDILIPVEEKFIGDHTRNFVAAGTAPAGAAPLGGGTATPPPRRGGPIMADVDRDKYEKTQKMMEKYDKMGGLDFYISDDYEANKDQYYDAGAMERISRTKEEEDRKREKFDRTKAKEEEYRKRGENFYKSKEYLDDQKRDENGKYIKDKLEYYTEETMHQKALIDPATGRDRMDTMTGIRSAKIKGQNGGSAALALDFNNEKVRDKFKDLIGEGAAGTCLTEGHGKEEAIDELGAFYADQLRAQNDQLEESQKLSDEQIQTEVNSLKSSLGKASSIRLVNKNREGYDAKSVLRHELMHDRIDNADQGKLKEIWDSMDKAKKAEIDKKIRSEWTGGDKFTDEQVRNEYFAEGAANFGRKDTEGGIQLEAGQAKVLQQAGVKMRAIPKSEEDIKVKSMSARSMRRAAKAEKRAEKAEAKTVERQQKRETKKSARQEKIRAREAKMAKPAEPKLSEDQELDNAKIDAQKKVSEYRQKVADRENKEKTLKDRQSDIVKRKGEAERIRQEAVKVQKEGKTNEAAEKLDNYNSRVEEIKKMEKEAGQMSKDIESAKFSEVVAKNHAQESSRNYVEKENAFKARKIDEEISELQALSGSKGVKEVEEQTSSLRLKRADLDVKAIRTGVKNVEIEDIDNKLGISDIRKKFEIEVPVTAKVKAPKIDFDKQISDLRISRQGAAQKAIMTGNNSEVKDIDKKISELQTQKANQPKESTDGGVQKVDINKEIRDLQNTIRSLKEGLKNPAMAEAEKDNIRKELSSNNVKLGFAKEQKNKAIEQKIQELSQQKVGLSQSQRTIEQSRFSPAKMGAAPKTESKPFAVNEFVSETSAANDTPLDYRVDATSQQTVNNNITNIINAVGNQNIKELTGAVVAGLSSPAGRFYITKALQKGMSSMPKSVRGLLAPDFVNLVSDSEKAVQDKELAGKMKNYIGDVKIALDGLGKEE